MIGGQNISLCHLTNIFFCLITGTKHKGFQDEVLEQR